MSATVTAARPGIASRLWAGYLRQLALRPLRTKMITSGSMFIIGDTIAQVGIEGRRIGGEPEPEGYGVADDDVVLAYNSFRAARQAVYGAFIFAPLAHKWLGFVDKVKYANKWRTLAAKLALDQLLWGPFIVGVFWTSTGILEGHSTQQVADLVCLAFPGAYSKSLMVFAPTQVINFTLVPLHHRLFVQQAVGLGWNCFLSYMTNKNNQLLAALQADLATAQAAEADVTPGIGIAENDHEHDDERAAAHAKVEDAEKALAAAQAQRKSLRSSEGGGATGAGTRMGW